MKDISVDEDAKTAPTPLAEKLNRGLIKHDSGAAVPLYSKRKFKTSITQQGIAGLNREYRYHQMLRVSGSKTRD